MTRPRFLALSGVAALIAMFLGAGPAAAGKEGVGAGPVFVPPAVSTRPTATLVTAAQVAQEITLAQQFCAGLERKEYVIDCLAAEYGRLADAIPAASDLAPAKAALKEASRKLSGIARSNRSSSLPTGVATSATRTSPRPLVPVATERLPAAADAAIGVIAETETILLRSSETSAEAAGFVAISAAVGSGTVLLRSL